MRKKCAFPFSTLSSSPTPSSRNALPAVEVDTVEATAARSVAATEAVVVVAIVNTDRTAVARAMVVAVSPDTVVVASLDTLAAVVEALTVAATAHRLPEATQATAEVRNRLLRPCQSQLNPPPLRP